ncbi:MAG: hypothetical protein RSD36_16765 [Terrisporobacter sp.]
MKYKFLSLVKRDLIFGFKNNRNKLMSIFVLLIILTYFNVLSIDGQAFELGLDSENINFIDLFFYIFKGIDYSIAPLPINWILINIYITYLIGSYCYDDLSEESFHMIVRMKNRKDIWASKVIWMVATILVFYLMLFLVISIFSTIMLNNSLEWSEFSKRSILNIIIKDYSSLKFILFTILIYILSSMTLSIFQMLISFIVKPTYIYIANICILAISLFLNKFLIPIQGSLILRQNIFDATYEIDPLNSIIYNLMVFIIIFVMGIYYIRKMDILASQKTN